MGNLSTALCPLWFFFVFLVVKLLAIFSTTKFTKVYTKDTKRNDNLQAQLCEPCGLIFSNLFTTKGTKVYTKDTKRNDNLQAQLCEPCGLIFSNLFTTKGTKVYTKDTKRNVIFIQAQPCEPCGIFFVNLVVKYSLPHFTQKKPKKKAPQRESFFT